MSKIIQPIIFGGSGISWNISKSMLPPTEPPTDTTKGNIVIITDKDIKDIKFVSNIDLNCDDLQEKSINLIIDANSDDIRFMVANKWIFGGKFGGNVVMNNGAKSCDIYVWDMLTQKWKLFSPLFMEIMDANSFLGKNIKFAGYFNRFNIKESINNQKVLPNNFDDSIQINNFLGIGYEMDSYFGKFVISDSPIITLASGGDGHQVYP